MLITGIHYLEEDFQNDDQNAEMLSLHTGHGGFCYEAPNIPLIGGKIKEVYLPIGTHKLIFYNYFTYFNIDITVHLMDTECFGLINICINCMQLYKTGNISIHKFY